MSFIIVFLMKPYIYVKSDQSDPSCISNLEVVLFHLIIPAAGVPGLSAVVPKAGLI